MNVQELRHSTGVSQLPNALPLVRLVRGATAAESRYETYWGHAVPGTSTSHAQSLDRLGPRRETYENPVSQGTWAGADIGIRRPRTTETALTAAEAAYWGDERVVGLL